MVSRDVSSRGRRTRPRPRAPAWPSRRGPAASSQGATGSRDGAAERVEPVDGDARTDEVVVQVGAGERGRGVGEVAEWGRGRGRGRPASAAARRAACLSIVGWRGASACARCDHTATTCATPSASAFAATSSTSDQSAGCTPLRVSPVSTLRCSRAGLPACRAPASTAARWATGRDGEVDVGGHRGGEVVVGDVQPGEHPGAASPAARSSRASSSVQTPSQVAPAAERGTGDRDGAVAVAVGLDHRHQRGVRVRRTRSTSTLCRTAARSTSASARGRCTPASSHPATGRVGTGASSPRARRPPRS